MRVFLGIFNGLWFDIFSLFDLLPTVALFYSQDIILLLVCVQHEHSGHVLLPQYKHGRFTIKHNFRLD